MYVAAAGLVHNSIGHKQKGCEVLLTICVDELTHLRHCPDALAVTSDSEPCITRRRNHIKFTTGTMVSQPRHHDCRFVVIST